MALVAKAGLGADDDELTRFAALYSNAQHRLEESSTRLDEKLLALSDWQLRRRRGSQKLFRQTGWRSGTGRNPKDTSPALISGIGGAAFHGVIRLAYAIEVSSPSRIAAALAYLAEVASPLRPLVVGDVTSEDPLEILSDLSASPDVPGPPKLKNIDEEMREVAQSELFDAAVSSLEITDDTDQKLAQAALVLYVSTDDFTALHGVTGSEAISSIRPWIDDDELLSRFAFQALTAAYLSIGAPPLWSRDRLDQFDGFNESDPLEVASIAAFNNDEHVSKLVYTARRLWEKQTTPSISRLRRGGRFRFPSSLRSSRCRFKAAECGYQFLVDVHPD